MWEYLSRAPTLYSNAPNLKQPITYRNKKICGMEKLTCNTCKLSYVAQTSHSLKQRYKEHKRYVKQNEPHSAYALHILNSHHEYGPFNTTMTP